MIRRDLRPSEATALVVAVQLPPELESLRLRSITDARDGLPSHITLLYPFAEPGVLEDPLLAEISALVRQLPTTTICLSEGRQWPGTAYAAVDPEDSLRALQATLAAAFPSLPLYGGAFPFVPHVSVVQGPAADGPNALEAAAWRSLPVTRDVVFVDLIEKVAGRWGTRRRFELAPRDA